MDTETFNLKSSSPDLIELPKSSLILCTRNRPQLLRETVTSILNAAVLPNELIIVDQSEEGNGWMDGLQNDKGCQIHHICTDVIGASHARNIGIQQARYDILAFIDDDMLVDVQWYKVLIRTLTELGVKTAVTGRVLAAPAEKPKQFVMAVHSWEEPSMYQGRIGKDILASGLMAIYRVSLQEIGGFDERLGPGTFFRAAEDNDLGFRLLESGYKIAYTPDCIVYHRAWRAISDYVPMYWSYGWGQGAFYAKHWKPQDWYTVSRSWKDFLRFLKLIPQRLWKHQLLILTGSAAFVLGEWFGAALWFLRGNRRK